jgi:hypothetical protein
MNQLINRRTPAALVVISVLCARSSVGRLWTDATGHYTVEADLVAFDDDQVILQRTDRELAEVKISMLSHEDQEYLKSKEASEISRQLQDKMQTWTMRSGLKVRGRVVDYARRDLTLQRRRGKIYVNDRVFDNLPEVYRIMLPKIVAHFDNNQITSAKDLESWLVRQKGQPRTFTCEGVLLELENGDEYAVPFFFFSEEDLQALEPGWREWLAAHEPDEREDRGFMLQSLAAAYQQSRQADRQIARMQLAFEAIQTGVASLWEVTLYPRSRNAGPPLWVVVPGRNSAQAQNSALARNPGYVVGPVRRVSR